MNEMTTHKKKNFVFLGAIEKRTVVKVQWKSKCTNDFMERKQERALLGEYVVHIIYF